MLSLGICRRTLFSVFKKIEEEEKVISIQCNSSSRGVIWKLSLRNFRKCSGRELSIFENLELEERGKCIQNRRRRKKSHRRDLARHQDKIRRNAHKFYTISSTFLMYIDINSDRMLVDGSLRHEKMSLWDTSYCDSSLFYNLPPLNWQSRNLQWRHKMWRKGICIKSHLTGWCPKKRKICITYIHSRTNEL